MIGRLRGAIWTGVIFTSLTRTNVLQVPGSRRRCLLHLVVFCTIILYRKFLWAEGQEKMVSKKNGGVSLDYFVLPWNPVRSGEYSTISFVYYYYNYYEKLFIC